MRAASGVRQTGLRGDDGFFLGAAAVIVAVVVGGFLNLLLQGVTSFGAPWPVHLHAFVFMGWVAFFALQVWLATKGPHPLHRRLGWLAAAYAPLILLVGTATIVRNLRLGTTPPMWTPAYFFVMNMMALTGFGILTAAALALRRHSDWHRRLMLCGMAALIITAVNRLMPVPVLFAVMSLASSAAIVLFPLAGMLSDQRRTGRAHPAWIWGLGVLVATGATTELLGRSPLQAQRSPRSPGEAPAPRERRWKNRPCRHPSTPDREQRLRQAQKDRRAPVIKLRRRGWEKNDVR